jgi:hypothetical protein
LRKYLFFLIFLFLFFIFGCGKKSDVTNQTSASNKTEFSWKDNLTINDIPDFPVRGNLNGEEVTFTYINFEKWRGSNDNVINFSMIKPEQQCGFIENFKGFQLINKGGSINLGDYSKGKFEENPESYNAFFKFTESDGSTIKSSSSWNCALKITGNSDKLVSGSIALCFNDEKKSWVAGKFEAVICNN